MTDLIAAPRTDWLRKVCRSRVTGADIAEKQKQLLLSLFDNWAGMADEQTTADTLVKIEATLETTSGS